MPMVVACVGVLTLLGAACAVCAALVVDHRRAQSAADLAALAGAHALSRGEDACAVAAGLASANGSRLLTCAVSATDVRISVEVAGPHWLGQYADVAAVSRAGWT
ncbi:Rv3654c family TadE-like protein [Nocardioides sp. Kera G14]|uniref:Rv3654c family TadE-like protein n=1 Tax=Nocardioides sp. Kera G14 TaxID=2884264 RepID=UPI0022391AB8|nr:Rv3654c family TadE-like protein [Nocardioides sp. Kera G14]